MNDLQQELRHSLSMKLLDTANARIEALEAALLETDEMVGALWADLFNKDMVKPGADWFFDKWRARMREITRAALDKDAGK
jgi:hypothetical protein